MHPLFYIKQGNLYFGNKHVLEDIEIYITKGDKVCLIGRNGSGKSSLMKIINQTYELDYGEMFRLPGITIGYLKQDLEFDKSLTVNDFVLSDLKDKKENQYKADIILESLSLDPKINLKTASGGELRRANLARVLVNEPDILLLDEPTNHLDIKTIEWLEEYIKEYKGAVICISHDRAFLSATTNKIWWIDRGKLKKTDKGFKDFDSWQEEVLEQEEAILRKLNKKLETENDWLGAGVTARRKRNQRRLAQLKLLREQLSASNKKLSQAKQKLQVSLSDEVKRTNFILEANDISFIYENHKIIENFTIKVKKGEKIGIIGPNGSGKSTLIKLLIKELEPSSGNIKYGTNLEISYIDQYRNTLNPDLSIKQILCPAGGDQVFLSNGRILHAAAYLKQFMFDPKSLNDKVSTLSGGQANRLLLARALIKPGNLLILDEPTNDLDMESLEVLLEILSEYKGTLIVVSHDRDFLDKLVTKTLIFTNNKIVDFVGSYEDYKKLYEQSSEFVSIKASKSTKKTTDNFTDKNPEKSKKISYKYQRALELIPQEIEDLESRVAVIQKKFENPNLYLTDQNYYNALAKELNELQEKIEQLTEEWINISSKNS